jgi:hypothetical protein
VTANSYSKTLVSYIDILGFAKMIERSRTDPAEIERLRNRLSVGGLTKNDFELAGKIQKIHGK